MKISWKGDMLARSRSWLLRTSIFINAIVFLYFSSYFSSIGYSKFEIADDGRNKPTVEILGPVESGSGNYEPQQVIVEMFNNPPPAAGSIVQAPSADTFIQGTTTSIQSKTTRPSTTINTSSGDSSAITSESLEPSLEDVIQCHDKDMRYRVAQKGDFWVLYNYVTPNRTFRCHETVTYTTHADYTYIDNIEPLIQRWNGPISIAMYAPGTDFVPTLNTIRYLRKCASPLISQFVSFHIYFGSKHIPKFIPRPENMLKGKVDCKAKPPWSSVSTASLYKTKKKLLYPVNVGRNIARNAAVTHYILPSDIELYPSPGVIPDFLEMIRKQQPPLLNNKPKVFPLPIFEVKAGVTPPVDKKQLVEMLMNQTAILFHKRVCPNCHNIPKSKEWMLAEDKPGLHVFHVGKRTGHFAHWEPIFIGTNQDPYYDERLSWEGKRDKMTQGYALCVLDYEFHILDKAFLVHKPGIKTLKKDTARAILAGKTNTLIKNVIFPELKLLYGTRKGCSV